MTATRAEQLRRVAESFVGFGVILVIWEYGAGLARMPEYVLTVPSVIVAKFWQTLTVQMHHLSVTAMTTVVGLVL